MAEIEMWEPELAHDKCIQLQEKMNQMEIDHRQEIKDMWQVYEDKLKIQSDINKQIIAELKDENPESTGVLLSFYKLKVAQLRGKIKSLPPSEPLSSSSQSSPNRSRS